MPTVEKPLENNTVFGETSLSVVIIGSTRGLGFVLAEEFLKRGCLVTISSRTS